MGTTATNKRLNETDEGQCKRPALGPTPPTEMPPLLDLAAEKMEEDAVVEKQQDKIYNPYEGYGLYAKLETIYPHYKVDEPRIGEGCCFVRVGLKDGAVDVTASKKTYCVLADRSQSMTFGDRYKNVCDTLQAMFSSIRETGDEDNVDVVVIAFNNFAEVIHGPGKIPDASEMAIIVKNLSPAGGTNIAKALEAFNGVAEACRSEGRPMIGVFFTDGEDSPFSQRVRAFKSGDESDALLCKLTAYSGVSVHYVAICDDADGPLLVKLAKISQTTYSRATGTAGLMGSFLGLCKEKMPETVTVTVTTTSDGAVVTHIDKKHINPRFGNDGHSINIPMKFGSAPGEISVEIQLFKVGAMIGESPAYTVREKFLWKSLKEVDGDGLASMDCVVEEVNRIKCVCDEGVTEAFNDNDFAAAGVVNDEALMGVAKLLELTLDESTIASLLDVTEELEVQGAEIAESIDQGYIVQESRDRAASRALTLNNGMSLSDPTYESQSQTAGRALSYQLASSSPGLQNGRC